MNAQQALNNLLDTLAESDPIDLEPGQHLFVFQQEGEQIFILAEKVPSSELGSEDWNVHQIDRA